MSDREASSDGSSTKESSRSCEDGGSGYLPPLPYDVRRPPFELIMRLQQERSSILAEVSRESQERDWFIQQLSATQKKIEQHKARSSSPFREGTPSPDERSVLQQLQSEAQRVTDGLRARFGTEREVERRHQERLRRIHHLELTMLRLQRASCDDLTDNRRVEADEKEKEEAAKENGEEEDSRKSCCSNGKDEPPSRETNRFVTTATQTCPSDLALEIPDVLLREGLSPFEPEAERNVSSAGQTCKLEVVYSLLSMLGTHDTEDLSRTLLAMTSSQDSCHAMRQSGCLPLLIQLLHGSSEGPLAAGSCRGRGSRAARTRATKALRNLAASNPDEKSGRRELRVLRLLEALRRYCDSDTEEEGEGSESSEPQGAAAEANPSAAVSALMKLSFDPEHHNAICALGGLQAIADLLRSEHDRLPPSTPPEELVASVTTRRFACMALTNLTFGDGANKALLCTLRPQLEALVAQLELQSEELGQVAASVLRNLSWRADLNSKRALREVLAPSRLMRAAMRCSREPTLRALLSALWNLSAHCTENKADICAVEGALPFLVTTLTYKSVQKSLAVIENGGGILRNISSVIALREDYRDCLRVTNCLPILLRHLRSPSLTVVSNACGTLWNLSANCARDQLALWELGAVPMLRALMHSRHKMISMGCASALKNLVTARPHLPVRGPLPGDVSVSTAQRKAKTRPEVPELPPSSASASRAASTASAPGHCGAAASAGAARAAGAGGGFAGSTNVPRSRSNDSVHSDQTYDRLRPPYAPLLSAFPPPQAARFLPPAAEWLPQLGEVGGGGAEAEQELRTFCTEGTPYGVSTAASVTDLAAEREEPAPATRPPEPTALRVRRLSRHRASVASGDGNESDANSEKPQDFGSRFGEGTAPAPAATAALPAVSPRTYAVEDTPLTGGASRASSLSSISELEEASSGVRGATVVPKAKTPLPPPPPPPLEPLERIEERAGSEAREAAAPAAGDGRKKVTFVMAQLAGGYGPQALAEETPLMFSRSSSLSSLGSSLGARSIHSSVVSDYSRSRNSEVVSPSELPDSPSAQRKEPPPLLEAVEDEEEAPEPPAGEEPTKENAGEAHGSSAASSCADDVTDRLLSLVIQSALPPKPPPGSQPPSGKKEAPGKDCVTLYAVEDTPLGFSTMASSLSDLTVDSHVRPSRRPQEVGSPPPQLPTRSPPAASPRPSSQRSSCRGGLRSAGGDSVTAPGSASTGYGPVIYATEGTPALYSYNSPLSSLFLSPLSTGANASPQAVRAGGAKGRGSGSSLSSLSLDSAGFDRSLLEECISSALPKVPRSAGVGAATPLPPPRSLTMPALHRQSARAAKEGGRTSRKDEAREAGGGAGAAGGAAGGGGGAGGAGGKMRHMPLPLEPPPPPQHQRSRSAGATSRSEVKPSSRLPAPPPPGPVWSSAPLSPALKKSGKKARRTPTTANNNEPPPPPPPSQQPPPNATSAGAMAASSGGSGGSGGGGGEERRKKERSLTFLSAGSGAGRQAKRARSEEVLAGARPVPLPGGVCVGTIPKRGCEREPRDQADNVLIFTLEDISLDVTDEASLTIDAAKCAKEEAPLSDPLCVAPQLQGEGLDDISVSSLSPVTSPVAEVPRPRIVKPSDCTPDRPAGLRGDSFSVDIQLQGEGLDDISVSSLSPVSSPVAEVPRPRIVKPSDCTPGRPASIRGGKSKRRSRELNNNKAGGEVRTRPKDSLASSGRQIDRTTRVIEPSELLRASVQAGAVPTPKASGIKPPSPVKSAAKAAATAAEGGPAVAKPVRRPPLAPAKPDNRAMTSPKHATNKSAAPSVDAIVTPSTAAKTANRNVMTPKSINRTMVSPKPNNSNDASSLNPNGKSVTSSGPNNRNPVSAKPNNASVTSPGPNRRNVTSPNPNNRNVMSPGSNRRNVTSPNPNNRNVMTSPGPNRRNVTSPKPNNRNVMSPGPNRRNVTSPNPNNSAVITSPGPNRRSGLPPRPNNKTMTSPAANRKNMTSPNPNNRNVTSPGPNRKNVTSPGPNRKNMTSPSPNTRNVTSPGPNRKNMTSPSPNTRNVTSPGPNRKNMTSPGPNSRNVTSPGPNRRNVMSPGPNRRNVTSPNPNNHSVMSPKTNRKTVTSPTPNNRGVTSPKPVKKPITSAKPSPAKAAVKPKLSHVKPQPTATSKAVPVTSSFPHPMASQSEPVPASPAHPVASKDSGVASSDSGVWISREEVAAVRKKPSRLVAPFCRRDSPCPEPEPDLKPSLRSL